MSTINWTEALRKFVNSKP